MNYIKSRKNETVKQAAALLKNTQKRHECGLFIIEGARLSLDAFISGINIKSLFYTQKAYEKYREYIDAIKACETYILDEHVFSLLSSTKNSQGICCVCEIPNTKFDASGKVLILEEVQDPSNLGTVMRCAEALGIKAIVLCQNCCDPYSPKVTRGSMGAVFRVPIIFYENIQSAVSFLKSHDYKIFTSLVTNANKLITQVKFPENSAVVIGNEGNGASQDAVNLCDDTLTIPMLGRAESLNASTAASIIMWEMVK